MSFFYYSSFQWNNLNEKNIWKIEVHASVSTVKKTKSLNSLTFLQTGKNLFFNSFFVLKFQYISRISAFITNAVLIHGKNELRKFFYFKKLDFFLKI
jgi:hypothetical protein